MGRSGSRRPVPYLRRYPLTRSRRPAGRLRLRLLGHYCYPLPCRSQRQPDRTGASLVARRPARVRPKVSASGTWRFRCAPQLIPADSALSNKPASTRWAQGRQVSKNSRRLVVSSSRSPATVGFSGIASPDSSTPTADARVHQVSTQWPIALTLPFGLPPADVPWPNSVPSSATSAHPGRGLRSHHPETKALVPRARLPGERAVRLPRRPAMSLLRPLPAGLVISSSRCAACLRSRRLVISRSRRASGVRPCGSGIQMLSRLGISMYRYPGAVRSLCLRLTVPSPPAGRPGIDPPRDEAVSRTRGLGACLGVSSSR